MHYADKKRIALNANTSQEFAYYMSSLVQLPRLTDEKIENEILCYHALTIRDKVIVATYKLNVAQKKRTTLSLTKGEVYALVRIFGLGTMPLPPLMQSVKYQITKGI